MILFDSDSDNSIVYEDISLLFYNIITVVAGAAIISRQIKTRTLSYVMISHIPGVCRYKKYLMISSVALLCSKRVKIKFT